MRALRSRTVEDDSENNECMMEVLEHASEEAISKKAKRKKSKKHTSDSENNKHTMQDFKEATDETVIKKIKRRKSKKHTSENESNEHIMDNSEDASEETVSKKIKRKKSKKHTSDKNDADSVVDENISKKKKTRKSKKRTIYVEDNLTTNNQTTDVVLNTSTESQLEADKLKKKSKKPKEFMRSMHVEDNSTIDNHTTETVLNTSTESQLAADKLKKRSRKPREFMRSTILNSPNFENVVTSTVMKPKRPEIKFEDSEIDYGIENKSSNIIGKLKKSKSEQKYKRQSKIEQNKKDIDLVSGDSILQTVTSTKAKRSTLGRSNVFDHNVTFEKTNESFENNSPNKLNKSKEIKKQESICRRTSAENSLNSNRDSAPNRRETFNKIPYIHISNGIDSVIAISDSLEISKLNQKTANNSNKVEPEITSDEEMITDDSLEQTFTKQQITSEQYQKETFNVLPKNKNLLGVEDTVITISDSPERNTFNQSDAQEPEITSDEEDETSDCEMKKIPVKLNDSAKPKTFDQSPNRTKESLGDKENATFSRSETFYLTPKNILLRKSEKSINETNILSVLENNKEYYGLSDIGDSIPEDVINISDCPEKTNIKSNTFNLSNDIADNTITKSNSEMLKSNDTFEVKIVNTSGDWQVEKCQVDTSKNEDIGKKLNDTFDVENKENDSQSTDSSKDNSTIIGNYCNITPNSENLSLSPKDKSIRKKWIKFPRHSSDAQTVLEQISSPILKKKMNASKIFQKVMSTPTDLYKIQNQPAATSNISVQKNSVKKTPKSMKKSPLKSIKKSAIKPVLNGDSTKKSTSKRTAMPNFALIHQKAYEKMENLAEYSERKKQRAQMLLSLTKAGSKRKSCSKPIEEKTKTAKTKSSRQLFTKDMNDIKFNRFGFKVADPTKKPTHNVTKPDTHIPIAKPDTHVTSVKPVVKPSVFARTDVVAIANKNNVVTNKYNRENRRDMLKGVRTNRRFELLMQMRNK